MNRRGFFGRLLGFAGAAVAVKALPAASPKAAKDVPAWAAEMEVGQWYMWVGNKTYRQGGDGKWHLVGRSPLF